MWILGLVCVWYRECSRMALFWSSEFVDQRRFLRIRTNDISCKDGKQNIISVNYTACQLCPFFLTNSYSFTGGKSWRLTKDAPPSTKNSKELCRLGTQTSLRRSPRIVPWISVRKGVECVREFAHPEHSFKKPGPLRHLSYIYNTRPNPLSFDYTPDSSRKNGRSVQRADL